MTSCASITGRRYHHTCIEKDEKPAKFIDPLAPSCSASTTTDSVGLHRVNTRSSLLEEWTRNPIVSLASETSSGNSRTQSNEEVLSVAERIMMRIPTTWTVGKVSVFVLLLATFTDFALCKMHSLDTSTMYDGMSNDVARTAFRHHMPFGGAAGSVGKAGSNHHHSRPRLGLGSAAISSVTEALSPILPFTGGVDLRREDYWTSLSSSWMETAQSAANRLLSVFGSQQSNSIPSDGKASNGESLLGSTSLFNQVPRGGGNLPGKLASQLNRSTPPKIKHDLVLSDPTPFVSLDLIGELTLTEVTEAFRYALESSKEGFIESKYTSTLVPRVKKMISGIKDAVAKSRGKDFEDCLVSQSRTAARPESGDIDILKFSAAMRIFAEWRVLRQVPEGYKGFAVGMNLGHKDVVQNVAKIERAVHSWLDHQKELCYIMAQDNEGETPENACVVLRTPTIREMLEHEKEMGTHPKLPVLKDPSGAMGLLWVRRQLSYQTRLFDNVLHVPKRFATTAEAVTAAYKQVYDQYHGWAVQKIFNYSFQSAPDADEIFKHMNPHKLAEVIQATKKGIAIPAPTSAIVEPMPEIDVLAATMPLHHGAKDSNPVDAFFKHVGGEWDKITGALKQKMVPKPQLELELLRGGSTNGDDNSNGIALAGNSLDEYITHEMVKDAHAHIANYLQVVDPLLDDIARVFDEYNMDDPTKV